MELFSEAIGLNRSELKQISEDLSPAKWVLYRQGDDGNEVELERFLQEHLANHHMKVFSERGHKQCYFVREIL